MRLLYSCFVLETIIKAEFYLIFQDMLVYEKASMTALPKGLYAGYLKLTSSVDLIRIMVPEKLPNVLPYCKIRDTPHVIKLVLILLCFKIFDSLIL